MPVDSQFNRFCYCLLPCYCVYAKFYFRRNILLFFFFVSHKEPLYLIAIMMLYRKMKTKQYKILIKFKVPYQSLTRLRIERRRAQSLLWRKLGEGETRIVTETERRERRNERGGLEERQAATQSRKLGREKYVGMRDKIKSGRAVKKKTKRRPNGVN